MAKKCCNKWKKKNKFCGSCPIPKEKRKGLTDGKLKVKKGRKVKKAEKKKKTRKCRQP